MNLEPKQMRPMFFQWMNTDRRTPSNGISSEFCDRLTVTLASVNEQGPIVPLALRLGPYQHPRVEVAVANVADFFKGIAEDFPIPDELRAMARGYIAPPLPLATVRTLKRVALIAKYASRWDSIKRDLSDGHKNGLSSAAKVGAHGMWLELKALEWATAHGKLHERPVLPVIFKPVAVPAVHQPRGKPRN